MSINIPDNATNGDIIRAVFPIASIWEDNLCKTVCLLTKGQGDAQLFDKSWWNAPYKTKEDNKI